MTLIETIDRIRELREDAKVATKFGSIREAVLLRERADRMESDMHRRIGWPS